ncbi:hypothetical protein [Primorskyibacter flagellatus]|nr:hypothetical protein [Primorskyibacter flagellatus]
MSADTANGAAARRDPWGGGDTGLTRRTSAETSVIKIFATVDG